MANFRLANIIITNPVDPAFTAGEELIVMWDSVAEDFTLTLDGAPFSTSGSLLGQLDTNYTILIGISSTENGYAIAGYSFCDGTDLNWFRMLTTYPEYPFFEKVITVNSPVCDVGGGVVCDILFSGAPSITHATDLTTGGSITVLATSSNGTVKYSLSDFVYATGGQTSGTFTGIIPGEWTLYAKDANDCTAVINFKMLFKPVEAEHYRFTWASKTIGAGTSRDARLRIYEREYIGDVVEVDFGSDSPFTLNKPKQGAINDKFFPIHPTNAVLSLMSLKDYQFLPLFTQDNKKYRGVYEVDEGAGFTEIWQGFEDPNTYVEDFINTPYAVDISFTDNVKTLEKEDFTDDQGNLLFGSMKLIKVIAHCMKKTGLNLSIRSGINIFETNHNTAATDDPLDQTYIDVACYRKGTDPFNCWDVLKAILMPFGARILQYENLWIIEEIDRAVADYNYRVFDSEGDYVSNSTTVGQVIDVKAPSLTDRVALTERDHSLEVVPAYGKITLTSKLNYIGSIVAGGFEKEDLLSPQAEKFNFGQGIYISEEGFRDWTLRLNGTEGVNFGRIVVSNRGDSSRTGLKTTEQDLTRSVGAFYYDPRSFSGNVRDAYIESSLKSYEYGPGDELKLYFQYSTPAKPEYEFMVIRLLVKVGNLYLQPDLSWSASETIYRAYPPISNSLQNFELTVAVPETNVVVDSTVQVRIYYYAPGFYDYGAPSTTSDPGDGVDGIAGLQALTTTTLNYDYRVDVRHQFTLGATNAFRGFRELRIVDTPNDPPFGAIRAGDFNAATNPKVWWPIKFILDNIDINNNQRGVDLKFYVDNVALDALINGQPPPEEDVLTLQISKYINEDLPVELFNFDLPAITNGKNMYNNYFRLSDGTPTALWTRSGIAESLSLQQILLKVLGGNHSAPTFRVTGSFINEFSRIGINNYLRITKPGSALIATNTEFASSLTGWSQVGTGETWAWTADNSGSAEVTLIGAEDSQKIYQAISHQGGYIDLTVALKAIPALDTNDSEDALIVVFFNGSDIVHTERIQNLTAITSESDYEFTYTAFAPGEITHLGFYIRRITGTGDVNYQVTEFTPEGNDVLEVYQIADYQSNERDNTYTFELMQLSKTYISLAGIDTGGTTQGGSTTGREHSSAYSSAYS